MRKIGLLGGMGPEATVLLQSRLITAVEAQDDGHHIPLIIDMNPQIPSRLTWIIDQTGADPGPVLVQMARGLERAGAECLAMPCNTAHHFAPQLEQATRLPFFNMPNLAAHRVAEVVGENARVGVLASPATELTELFKKAFSRVGGEVVYPQDQSKLLQVIKDIKAHGPQLSCARRLQREADALVSTGVDCILVGCSEFSLLSKDIRSSVPMIDTLDVLVDRLVEFSGAKRKARNPP